MGKVINFLSKVVNKPESVVSLRIDSIAYSAQYGHEVCILQMIGKTIFSTFIPEFILNDTHILNALSAEDIVTVARLDQRIKNRLRKNHILSVDPSGMLELKDESGQVKRYTEKTVSINPKLLENLSSLEAHDIGYRVGYREGRHLTNKIKNLQTAQNWLGKIFQFSKYKK